MEAVCASQRSIRAAVCNSLTGEYGLACYSKGPVHSANVECLLAKYGLMVDRSDLNGIAFAMGCCFSLMASLVIIHEAVDCF